MTGRNDLVELVKKIMSSAGSEDEVDAWIDEFQASVPHPAASDLIFHHEGDLTAEEVVDLALAYRPVELPPRQ